MHYIKMDETRQHRYKKQLFMQRDKVGMTMYCRGNILRKWYY